MLNYLLMIISAAAAPAVLAMDISVPRVTGATSEAKVLSLAEPSTRRSAYAITNVTWVYGTLRGGVPRPAHRNVSGEFTCQGKTSKPYSACADAVTYTVRPIQFNDVMSRRRRYRAVHKKHVSEELICAVANVQGLNYARTDNRLKLASLFEEAKRGKWDIVFLADVHVEESTETTVCCVEEYSLVLRGKVGIMMHASVVQTWRRTSAKIVVVEGCERLIAVVLSIHGREYAYAAAYAPHSSTPTSVRSRFLRDIEAMHDLLPTAAHRIYGGDWNAHMGKDSCGQLHMGKYALPTPTSPHAWDLATWAAENGLWHIDSHLPTRHRATWRLPGDNVAHKWYEPDYILSDISPDNRRWRGLKTCALAFGDHFVKISTVCLLGRHGGHVREGITREDGWRSGFDNRLRPYGRLCLDYMKGPTTEARELVGEYSDRVTQRLSQNAPTAAPTVAAPAVEAGGTELQRRLAEAPEVHDNSGDLVEWRDLAKILREEAENTVGRSSRDNLPPAVKRLQPMHKRFQAKLRDSWETVRLAQGTEHEAQARAAHRALRKSCRGQKGRMRAAIVLEIVKDLEYASKNHDTGGFYRHMRQLGVWLSDSGVAGRQEFTPEDGRKHFLGIGGETNEVDEGVLEELPEAFWQQCADHDDVSATLADPLTDKEIHDAIRDMRVSAGGDDEITLGLIRAAGAARSLYCSVNVGNPARTMEQRDGTGTVSGSGHSPMEEQRQ